MRAAARFAVHTLFAALIAIPVIWVNGVLDLSAAWDTAAVAAVVLAVLPAALPESVRARISRPAEYAGRALVFALLAGVPWLLTATTAGQYPATATFFALTVAALFGASLLYSQPDSLRKLAMIAFGLVISAVMMEIIAGVVLREIEDSDREGRPQVAAPPLDANPRPLLPDSLVLARAAATATPTPEPDPQPDPPPDPPVERPIAGYGYMDIIEDGGEAEWGHLTGYGPRVNSVVRAYMVDAGGELVYDTTVRFNGKGSRGPELSYDKPDDVYRILIIGDSFVEALQVAYEDTFYARLQDRLAAYATPGQRFEVVATGRTGWGTLQEYLYYHHEGYKYNADLVILLFYINDVADNYPSFFYPGINNTNFDYVIDGDRVQIVDKNKQPLPPNVPRKLYNALPDLLRRSNLARLYVRLGDPPDPVLTPGGVMTRVHPQFYIYVTEPEPEGYDTGWERTAHALELLARETHANGSDLAVVPVFIGAEFIQNVSGWFPELVAGWQWDDSLPEQRLAAILDDLPADLVPTRPVYEAYAQEAGQTVYDLIFLPEDRHFNARGHALTAETILGYLQQRGIVPEE